MTVEDQLHAYQIQCKYLDLLISRWVLLLTDPIACQLYEPSQVQVVRVNSYLWGRDFDTGALYQVNACLFAHFTLVSITLLPGCVFFCSVELPQLFRLFHWYLRIGTRENNASCCFGFAGANMLPLWPKSNLIFHEISHMEAAWTAQQNGGL